MAYYDSTPRSHDHYNRNDYSSRSSHVKTPRHDQSDFLSVTDQHPGHGSRSRSKIRHAKPTSRSTSSYRQRSRSSRRRWPPQPIVEDEAISLRKEYRPRYSAPDGDVESRGSIDQDPLMIGLISSDKRFVLQVTPQTSDSDSKAKNEALKMKLRGRKVGAAEQSDKSSLKLDTNISGILEERRPSPYSFSRTSATRVSTGDYVMSPESLAPRLSSSVPHPQPRRDAQRRGARKKGSSGSSDAHYSSRSDLSEDSDIDPREVHKRREAHISRSARPSLASPRSRNSSSQYRDLSDTDSDRRRREQLRPRPRPISRISTRLEQLDDRSDTPKASLLNPPDTRRESFRHTTIPGATPPSPRPDAGMGASSPRSNTVPKMNQPSRSPRTSWSAFPYDSPIDRAVTPSKHNAVPKETSKVNGSLPVPSMRKEDFLRSASVDQSVRRPPAQQRAFSSTTLPYPDADVFVSMPTAQSFMGPDNAGQKADSVRMSRESSLQSDSSSSFKRRSRDEPSTTPQRSSTQDLPVRGKQSSVTKPTKPSRSLSSSSNKLSEPYILPACPRRRFTNKYDNWWSLKSFPTFDVCSPCLNDIIRPTQFRNLLDPAPRRPSNVSIRCDFGSPWIRLAWLLCKKRELQDGSLVLKLAEKWERSSPCSEEQQKPSTESWGLVDKTGYYVSGFKVCSRDKSNIETLFPSLEGAFTKLPIDAPKTNDKCAMRSDSRRLGQYLDLMDRIHDKAVLEYFHHSATSSSFDIRPRRLNGSADARPLVDLAAELTLEPECPRDQPTKGMKWHYVVDNPDLTVCPDCFEDVVSPDVQGSAAISTLFTTTPKSTDHLTSIRSSSSRSGSSTTGLTCQLYSSRMRRAWDQAVTHDDAKSMLRKLRERRTKEVQLRHQKIELTRMLQRSSTDMIYLGGGLNRELLLRDLASIERQWKDNE